MNRVLIGVAALVAFALLIPYFGIGSSPDEESAEETTAEVAPSQNDKSAEINSSHKFTELERLLGESTHTK